MSLYFPDGNGGRMALETSGAVNITLLGEAAYSLPPASKTELGGVKVGNGLNVDSTGKLDVTLESSDYSLTPATNTKLGGVIVGAGGLTIGSDGKLSLRPARKTMMGGVMAGEGLSVDANGKLDVTISGGSDYVLPAANASQLGGVKIATKESIGGIKVGDGLSIAKDGKLDVTLESSDYSLPPATETQLGGVKVGRGLVMGLIQGSSIRDILNVAQAERDELGGIMLGKGFYWDSLGDVRTHVNIGEGLAFDSNGKINVTLSGGSDYVLPKASATQLGGVIVGEGLSVNSSGKVDVTANYTLTPASETKLGGVKVGDGLTVDSTGKLDVTLESSDYSLPPATTSQLGGIIAGEGLSVDSAGKLDVIGNNNFVRQSLQAQSLSADLTNATIKTSPNNSSQTENTVFKGTSAFTGCVTVGSEISTLNTALDAQGGIHVAGDATLDGKVSVQGSIKADSTIEANGIINRGTAQIDNNTTINGHLYVSKDNRIDARSCQIDFYHSTIYAGQASINAAGASIVGPVTYREVIDALNDVRISGRLSVGGAFILSTVESSINGAMWYVP